MGDLDLLLKLRIFRTSLAEQQDVLRDFWDKAGRILSASGIALLPFPPQWASLKHNCFSVLFIAIFHILGIPPARLRLYARLNHCLRAWVTSCDNLLDEELRETILTDLPRDAKVFKSVHTILVADRIFFSFLLDALHDNTITDYQMTELLRVSLTSLSASGKEEAEEENGADYSLSPRDVLNRIHHAKTGQLFTSPLAAPAVLNDICSNGATDFIRTGLCHLGIGCQILDDLNDLAVDLHRRKHNYLAALIIHGEDVGEKERLLDDMDDGRQHSLMTDSHYARGFPRAFADAQQEAASQFEFAVDQLCRGGFPLNTDERQTFLRSLMLLSKRPCLAAGLRAR